MITKHVATEQELNNKFKELGIAYTTYNHQAAFTVEEMSSIKNELPECGHCKNLFLKDSKKRVWLIVALCATQINLKEVSKLLQAPELRFADADMLMNYLGVIPGSVTPFGLLNDTEHAVHVVLDKALFTHDQVGFHPLRNDATTIINVTDLQKFVAACGNLVYIMDFKS
jgi:Ala-tRNA(Pro) deacylase